MKSTRLSASILQIYFSARVKTKVKRDSIAFAYEIETTHVYMSKILVFTCTAWIKHNNYNGIWMFFKFSALFTWFAEDCNALFLVYSSPADTIDGKFCDWIHFNANKNIKLI